MRFQTMDILASRQAQLCYVTFCPRAAHGSGQVQALAEITSLLGSCPLVSLGPLLLHRILLNSSHSRNHMYLNPFLRLCSQRTKSKTLFHKVVIMTSEDRVFFVVVVCLFFPSLFLILFPIPLVCSIHTFLWGFLFCYMWAWWCCQPALLYPLSPFCSLVAR